MTSRYLVLAGLVTALPSSGLAQRQGASRKPVFDCEAVPRFSKHLQLRPLQTLVEGSASCVYDRDARSRWLVTGTVRDDAEDSSHFFYLELDRRGLKRTISRGPSFKSERFLRLKAVADFDRDGVSEIIGEEIAHSADAVSTSVVVLASSPSGTVRLLDRRFEFKVNVGRYTGDQDRQNHSELSCKSKYSVIEKNKRAAIAVSPGVLIRQKNVPRSAKLSEDHCQSKRTIYGWNGDRLAATSSRSGRNQDDETNDAACPRTRYLAKALRLRGGETFSGPVRCLRGRFPRKATVVAARISKGSEIDLETASITLAGLDAKGRLLFRRRFPEYGDPTGVFESYSLDRVADLNGDGTDEILLRGKHHNPMSSSDSLLVLARRGRTLRTLVKRDLGSDEHATFGGRGEHDYRPVKPENKLECRAKLSIVPAKRGSAIVITRTRISGKNVKPSRQASSCKPSKEVYRYTP